MPVEGGCYAVIHRPGMPDEILDGSDGRPQRFASASQALAAAERAAGLCPPPVSTLDAGIADWRARRDREIAEERERVFGSMVKPARAFVVEKRRRRP